MNKLTQTVTYPPTGEPEQEEKQPNRRLRFLPAAELIASQALPSWLIKNLLELGTLTTIFGPSETLKSFVALSLGFAVATGKNWFCHKTKATGKVLYLCGEGGGGIRRRLKAWLLDNSLDDLPNFHVSTCPAALIDGGGVEEVLEAAQEVGEEITLIIVDTVNRNFGAGDENGTADMTEYVKALDRIKAATGAAILNVHHTGLADSSRARGSVVLRSSMDFEYKVSLVNKIPLPRIQFEATKTKDFAPIKPMVFDAEIIRLGEFDEDFEELTSLVLRHDAKAVVKSDKKKLPTAARIALEALTWLESDTKGPVHVDDWRVETYRRNIADTPDAKKKAFSRARIRLLGDNLIAGQDDKYELFKHEIEGFLDKAGQGDKAGQNGTMSPGVPVLGGTDRDTPLKGCPVSPSGCPDSSVEAQPEQPTLWEGF